MWLLVTYGIVWKMPRLVASYQIRQALWTLLWTILAFSYNLYSDNPEPHLFLKHTQKWISKNVKCSNQTYIIDYMDFGVRVSQQKLWYDNVK